MKIYNIVQRKGGEGKSETALNLAYGFSQKGLRTLLIDLDPQANATGRIMKSEQNYNASAAAQIIDQFNTSSNGKDTSTCFQLATELLHDFVLKTELTADVHNVLESPKSIQSAIYKTDYDNLWIIPASKRLSETDIRLKVDGKNPSGRLRQALDLVKDDYDVVVIDNSPFTNALTYNAINACMHEGDTVIVPVKISRGGLEGLDDTIHMLLEWLEYETCMYDLKILITMKNKNANDIAWSSALQTMFKDFIYKTEIRYQAKPVSNASLQKRILIEDQHSAVAADYRKLIDEITGGM